ncbi:Protein N-acetyltransferase, RimJ/RimL family [Formosa sp. Hel1_31_208]|uniref:GNAT family N-acetyltransferase n=1 Tax=Formosa sp. Hel1_31_208 TaxID=1798225 RepID=UPI0008799A64|nr:GNAT family N-acetyltransferase [Formosa sp. Hel1_31_208]SDR69164.1 Protein N-acetyltransferase, RimJ/RimL family [Formosa sp. Hel1_31_208]
MVVAETERLILSKISIEDAPFILELMNSPDWINYIGDRNIRTIKQAEIYIQNNQLKSYKRNGFGYYKVLLKAENLKPIGSFGLIKRDQLEHVDIGFSLLPKYQCYGFGLEGVSALMSLAKNTFKLHTICAITLPENEASIHLLEKLGLSYQKRVKPFEDDEELLLFAKIL